MADFDRILIVGGGIGGLRPLGATLGDLLDKPVDHGGFAFSRYSASGILAALIVACILFLPQNAGSHPGQEDQRAS